MSNIKRFTAVVLSIVLVLGLAPVSARADGEKTLLWDFAGGTAGATMSGASITTSNADRGTITATVSADGGYANGKSMRYAVSSPATNSNYQTQTMRLAGGSINGYQLSEGDILWFYLKSDTDVNYRMLVQFRVGNSSKNFSTTTVYKVDGNGNVATINRVTSATIAEDGLALENHAGDGSIMGFVVGKAFEGWVGIPIVSTDTAILGGTLQAIDFFVRKSGKYTAAVGAGSNIYFDNLMVTAEGYLPAASWLSQPSKTEYNVGEALDTTDGVVRVGNIDGSTYYDINLTSGMVSNYDPYRAGLQTLNCEYEEGLTFSYDVTVAAAGDTRTFLWDVDTETDSFVFPSHDTTANRGAFGFSIAEGAGVGGSAAFAMTVEAVSTSAGIINGTLQKQSWSAAGVTGFTTSEPVSEGDICWFWVDNELGSNQYVVAEFIYDNNGTYTNAGATASADRTELIYTVSGGKVVPVNPATTISGIRNVKSTRGAIQVYDGAKSWVGIPLYDITALRGKTIDGIRLYVRSASGDNNGVLGSSIYFDEFTICSLGLMPGRNTVTLNLLDVTSLPTKTSYRTGEAFKVDGGELSLCYGDGAAFSSVPLTIDMISGYNPNPASYGTQTITATYAGLTDTFEITMTEDTASYAHCLLDIDSLNSESRLPTPDTQNAARGVTNVTVEQKGLIGTNALALTVATTSTNAGIQNGVTNNWLSVTGFSASREIRKGDLFWIWVDNEYSTKQYVVFEFGFNDGGGRQAGTAPSSSRTTPIYTISNSNGTPVITTISAGKTVNGITNVKNNRGAIQFASGASGWLGIPLDNIVATDSTTGEIIGRLWGSSIRGIRLYTRSLSGNDNGIIGESIYFDEPWVTSAGTMPALADNLLLEETAADVMSIELRESVTANFYVSPDVEVGSEDTVVFHASLGGGRTVDCEAVMVTGGNLAGKYHISLDEIHATDYCDTISGTFSIEYADGSDPYVFKSVSDSDGISVAGYCDRLVAAYPENTTLCNLLANMILFGDEAQLYNNHNTDTLPTTGRSWVSTYSKSFAIPGSDMSVVTPAVDKTIGYIKGATLRINEKIAVAFNVSVADISGAVLRVTAENYSKEFDLATDPDVTPSNTYGPKVFLERILPQDFGKVYTAQLVIGGAVVHSVRYSVNSYINRMNSDSAVGAIVTALNNYGCAAVAYSGTDQD